MMPPPKEIETALTAVVGRLGHLRTNWNQALSSYFDPYGFLIALQSAITSARSVTFIVQSHKASIPDFETWYLPVRTKFEQDPLMQWVKNARNKIEKQGDLETLSQVRAEIIAAYAYHPHTDWMPVNVMWSTDHFRKSIPQKYRDRHVVENGALAIERRWVDVELPDHELLDALAHVYGQLALMAISLHDQSSDTRCKA